MELHENHMQYACVGQLASIPEIEIIEHDWDMLVRWTEFTNIEESTLAQQIAFVDIPQLPMQQTPQGFRCCEPGTFFCAHWGLLLRQIPSERYKKLY